MVVFHGILSRTVGNEIHNESRVLGRTFRWEKRFGNVVILSENLSGLHLLPFQNALAVISRLTNAYGSIDCSDHRCWESNPLILA